MLEKHSELLAMKGCTDPNVVMGYISGWTGIPETDVFVLVPILVGPVKYRAEHWIALFERAGVKIRPRISTS